MTRRRLTTTFALAGALLLPAFARAQDEGHGAGPDSEEVKKKILEVEKLMKSAEEALARSTDTRSAAERSAEAAKKILEKKAQQETGKSCDQLRKEAESGSKEAKETLERLTKAAQQEAEEAAKKMTEILGNGGGQGGASGASGGSSGGIKELIEKIKGDGKGASERMKWLLDQTRPGQGQQQPKDGGKGKPEKQQDKPDPEKPEKKPEEKKPEDGKKKPPEKTEPPRSPEFVQWIAELPPQVRRAVESQDWDSIPPKWRDMLRDWTKKMAEESEKENR